MGANEERIIEDHLSARRFVVGVVQSHQAVPEKRHKVGASRIQLVAGRGGLHDFDQIGAHLELSVAVIVKTEGPFSSLTAAEERLGHLEFTKRSGKPHHTLGHRFALGHLIQAVSQAENSIERNQPLCVQNGADLTGEFLLNLLPLLGSLVRTGKQGNNLILRKPRFAGRGQEQFSKRGLGRVKNLSRGEGIRERIDSPLPGVVPVCFWYSPLPGQDLPEPHFRLENSQGIGSGHVVRDSVKSPRHGKKPRNGVVVQGVELGKHKILIAEA